MCDSCKKINKCWGKNYCEKYERKTEQTNDEWRKTCSTEEFAEFLNFIAFDWNRVDKQWVLEWLKQPHTSKE